ncbi:beta-aspartyl-peptidase [Alginatibacterium sediminis]|uniref:Isoaspartyl dipeptidase n=1 Tax=Alginatibacterium sediminis TaxID=2164068 RepID=A0A420ELI2_9ALTE|nr:beta-aspartyl-peptidase [Alginatibacterium sediminis]RKF21543.1 beta-aspartyl-peptidase [Alginatibacterium sediminis]
MLTLIENVELFAPQYLGQRQVLIAADKISAIYEELPEGLVVAKQQGLLSCVDGRAKRLLPGFVDGLVHFCGGGGEGGFGNRTPELLAPEAAAAGVTTLVGALGTDSITRTLSNVLGKARELQAKGLSTYFYSGSYHIPLATLTQSLETDLLYIPEIIGVGEIALSDHRGSVLEYQDLLSIAKRTITSASLAGKKGVIFCHMGDGSEQLALLEQIAEQADIHISHFVPTHMNRNPSLCANAIRFAKLGGYVDLTTSSNQQLLDLGEVKSASALAQLINAGVAPNLITMSSDANASLPVFDDTGRAIGVDVGRIASLYEAVCEAHCDYGVDFSTALMSITQNPATALGLYRKGLISGGYDADLVLVDEQHLAIEKVWSKGQQVFGY